MKTKLMLFFKKIIPKSGRAFRGFVSGLYEFVELLAFTVLAIFLLTTLVFRHTVVWGDSMNNTLQTGEHLLISNLFYTPQNGDVIVIDDDNVYDKVLIKRVIAVGGQSVKVTNEGVFVDGEQLNEEEYALFLHPLPPSYYFEDTVPEWQLFVMGDNRCNSFDSMDFGYQFVDERAVLGKAVIRLYPFSIFVDGIPHPKK